MHVILNVIQPEKRSNSQMQKNDQVPCLRESVSLLSGYVEYLVPFMPLICKSDKFLTVLLDTEFIWVVSWLLFFFFNSLCSTKLCFCKGQHEIRKKKGGPSKILFHPSATFRGNKITAKISYKHGASLMNYGWHTGITSSEP